MLGLAENNFKNLRGSTRYAEKDFTKKNKIQKYHMYQKEALLLWVGPGVLEQQPDFGIQKKEQIWPGGEKWSSNVWLLNFVLCAQICWFLPLCYGIMAFNGDMIFTLELEFLFKSNSAYCDPIHILIPCHFLTRFIKESIAGDKAPRYTLNIDSFW